MIAFFVNYSTVAFPLHLPFYLGGMAVLFGGMAISFGGYGSFIWEVWPYYLGSMAISFGW